MVQEMFVYILLGLMQGITEWLPISSSGHLVLTAEFFGLETSGLAFEVFLNFATLLAMLVVFRKDLKQLLADFFLYLVHRKPKHEANFRFGLYLILATIPAGILGLLFGEWIEYRLASILTVGVALIFTGVALWMVSRMDSWRSTLTVKDALIIGLFQAIALIPGISRSGATLVGGLLSGVDREIALRFSFFLAIPVSVGTMLLKMDDLFEQIDPSLAFSYLVSFLVAFVSAVFAIKWFIGILNRGKLIYFTYYCWIVGGLVILYHYL